MDGLVRIERNNCDFVQTLKDRPESPDALTELFVVVRRWEFLFKLSSLSEYLDASLNGRDDLQFGTRFAL